MSLEARSKQTGSAFTEDPWRALEEAMRAAPVSTAREAGSGVLVEKTPEMTDADRLELQRVARNIVSLTIHTSCENRYIYPPTIIVGFVGDGKPSAAYLSYDRESYEYYLTLVVNDHPIRYLIGSAHDAYHTLGCRPDYIIEGGQIKEQNPSWKESVGLGFDREKHTTLIFLANNKGQCALGNIALEVGSKTEKTQPKTLPGDSAGATKPIAEPIKAAILSEAPPSWKKLTDEEFQAKARREAEIRREKGYGPESPIVSRVEAETTPGYVEVSRYGVTFSIPGSSGEARRVAQAARGSSRGRR